MLMARFLLAPDFKNTAIGGKIIARIRTILLSIGFPSYCYCYCYCYWRCLTVEVNSADCGPYCLLFLGLAFPAKIETAVILFGAFAADPRFFRCGIGKPFLDD
jgi:hypothetical protein